jgi:toxin ParE1/3/4
MRKVRIAAEADRELNEAAAWHEARSPGTGARLLDAFENAVTVLREDPVPLLAMPGEAGALGAQRLLLHRFPFDIVIIKENDEFVVIAVAHHARRPGYWMERLRT